MADLRLSERRVVEAATAGEEADLRPHSDEEADVSQGCCWGEERTVQAEFLYDLFTGKRDGISVHPRGIRLRGAKISGKLNLEPLRG
jgi:hypothetical protein